ncbi:uncharacterized protein MELLADRAFT_102272 [Melampsora larici-populina 98AG31]|uniref:Uncharacterized protein n=1 Tax=Melampsora larici-populina (strain 98AG31 / pathotype 3-4-7) TaxID=747676 RepID=F4R7R5_MELLP|nr:uncharacterized protein MELLADRAFT_102272 [Melampsora larici-populina 98AG31]EGG11358.1 hypothetical protein MELLADRAFT_102272 [Melampsora larici-populina 98AG31]
MVTFLEELAESRKQAEEALYNRESGPRIKSRSRNRNKTDNQNTVNKNKGEEAETASTPAAESNIEFVSNHKQVPGTKLAPTNSGGVIKGVGAGLICPFGQVQMEKDLTKANSDLSEEEVNGVGQLFRSGSLLVSKVLPPPPAPSNNFHKLTD